LDRKRSQRKDAASALDQAVRHQRGDVRRDFAKEKGLDTEEAVAAGVTAKSDEFTEAGGEIYS
jgi:hypothetical protein